MYCPSLLGLCRLHKPNSLYSVLSIGYSVQKNLVPHSVNILFSLLFLLKFMLPLCQCVEDKCVLYKEMTDDAGSTF